MQGQVHVCMNTGSGSFFDIFKHASIKSYPKHVPTFPKVSGFHINSSRSKTQAFTLSKNGLKWKIKEKLKNDKSLKSLLIQSLHPLKDVNEGDSFSLTTPFQPVRLKGSLESMLEVFLDFSAMEKIRELGEGESFR